MFHHDGRWKEFGINGVDTTYFPFWFFCIVWAIVTYGIVRIFVSDASHEVAEDLNASSLVPASKPRPRPQAEALSPLPVTTTPATQSPENTQGKPGYYKLDEAVMKEMGTPLYVYIGPDKPVGVD